VAAHCTLELVAVIYTIVRAVNRIAVVVTVATIMVAVVHEFMRGYVAPLGMVPWCKSDTIARKETHSEASNDGQSAVQWLPKQFLHM